MSSAAALKKTRTCTTDGCSQGGGSGSVDAEHEFLPSYQALQFASPRELTKQLHLRLHIAEQQSLEHVILFSFSIDQLSEITMYKDFPLQVVRACNSLSLSCITLISILSHHLLCYYFACTPTLGACSLFPVVANSLYKKCQLPSIPLKL